MYYVIRKVGMEYEILDDSSNSKQVLAKSDIKSIVDRGIYIKGVAYIDNKLTITPVPPLFSLDRLQMAKNKIITGTLTGIAGFDLELGNDSIIALPLSDEFLSYIDEYAEEDGRFVLSFPDCITSISSHFLDCFYNTDMEYRLYVDLPSSLSSIGESGLSYFSYNPIVAGIKFNGVVDRVFGDFTNSTISICNSSKDFKFNVRHIEPMSIDLSYKYDSSINDVNIFLPDTEVLESTSIIGSRYNVFLGNSIREIGVFSSEMLKTNLVSSDRLMNGSSIVYIPDDCHLEKINFVVADSYGMDIFIPHIVVLSDKMYESLNNRYKDGDLEVLFDDCFHCMKSNYKFKTWVGIITYSIEAELEDLKFNLRSYLSDYDKYFSNCFNENNCGSIIQLKLRNN